MTMKDSNHSKVSGFCRSAALLRLLPSIRSPQSLDGPHLFGAGCCVLNGHGAVLAYQCTPSRASLQAEYSRQLRKHGLFASARPFYAGPACAWQVVLESTTLLVAV